MSRRREWIKFGSLAALTAVLALAFVAATDGPKNSHAQQPEYVALVDRPAPVTAPANMVELGNSFTAVAEAVRPTVVYIVAESRARRDDDGRRRGTPNVPPPFDRFFDIPDDVRPQPQRGQGSGFIITPDGYVMTNNHVVEGFDRVTVELFDGRRFQARVVGRDPKTDVAVIKVEARNLPAVSFGNSDAMQVGEWVLAIGNPLGSEFSFTVTAGIVSGRGRGLRGLSRSQWDIQDFIQTDAAINPGNSGGPLVNIRGQVVGVNSAIASQTGFYAGYSFAIPINLARTVADQLIRDGRVTRAALGVLVQNAGQLDAEAVGLDSVRGVLVQGFSDNSPAQRAGLRPGDVIVSIDGRRVEYVAQLQQIVGFKQPGSTVQVTVMRDTTGQAGPGRESIPVKLIAAETDDTPTVASGPRDSRFEDTAYGSKLGIAVEPVDERTAARLDDDRVGVVITEVDPDGPAREQLIPANVRAGIFQMITHVNSTRVQSPEELDRALADLRGGSVVTLRVTTVQGRQVQPGVVRLRAR